MNVLISTILNRLVTKPGRYCVVNGEARALKLLLISLKHERRAGDSSYLDQWLAVTSGVGEDIRHTN